MSTGTVLRIPTSARMHRASGRLCLTALLLLLAAAVPKSARADDPTMDELWPNDDGLSWTYNQTYQDYFSQETVQNQARFYFDGTTVVPGGILTQNYQCEVIDDRAPKSDGLAKHLGLPDAAWAQDPFWRNLWLARPDVRGKIEASMRAAAGKRTPEGMYQLLLHDCAYVKNADEICAYRTNAIAMRSWLYLVSDVTIGAQFHLQLVPDLADSVWLHGTVAAWEDVSVPAGAFAGCLRVDYLIDYGEAICTTEAGEETGGFRSQTRGSVYYAPGVGPVQTREEFVPYVELLWGSCALEWPVGEPITAGELLLASSPPTPIETTSWGRIKAAFR
jgi:hypothetical protein